MTAWSLFLFVASAHALGVASPGPDFAMVVRQTFAHGRRIGVATALGIGSGISFHVAWGMFGLGWVLDRHPAFLVFLRYGGAAFLLWMGTQALRSKPAAGGVSTAAPAAGAASASRAFGVGLMTNLLNAKAMLFFVAMCSAVLSQSPSVALRLAMGAWLMVTTAAWFSFVAFTVGHEAIRGRLLAHAHRIDHAMGAILVVIALWVALAPALAR